MTQTQVQGECEYGASFNPDGRLLWKAHVANWRESSIPTLDRVKFVYAPMNVDQIFGVMHQDGLPKRAIRTARRRFFVYYSDHGDHRCRTRADRVFCKNWTAHRRNEFLKDFGENLPLPILLLARRLRTGADFAWTGIIGEARRNCLSLTLANIEVSLKPWSLTFELSILRFGTGIGI